MYIHIYIFLTSALVRGDRSASHLGRFTSGTHWIGGWVRPRTGVDDMERRKSYPYRHSNSDPSPLELVDSRYTDRVIPASGSGNKP
jgi:hypothetical protein